MTFPNVLVAGRVLAGWINLENHACLRSALADWSDAFARTEGEWQMSSSATMRQQEPGGLQAGAVDDHVRTQVWNLLGMLYPRGNLVERRGEQRYPYPFLIHLTPVAADGVTPDGDAVVVVGKHLSERGLGFYHPKPLAYRYAVASLEAVGGSRLAFLIDLSWCRFTRQGWYESGGRFLRAVAVPAGVDE